MDPLGFFEQFQASSIFRDRAVVPSRAVSTQKPSSGSNAAAVISGCLNSIAKDLSSAYKISVKLPLPQQYSGQQSGYIST